jgi:hypothetical protein
MAGPDQLDQIIASLKYASATRAKFYPDGTLAEIEFAPEVAEEQSAAPQQPEPAHVVELKRVINDSPQRRAGYAQLFPNDPPGFRGVDE